MTSRPASIRNVAWAVVRDGAASRHVYRRDVDLFLKDRRIVEITPTVRTVLVNGEIVLAGGTPVHLDPAGAMERLAEAQARMLKDSVKHDYAARAAEEIAPLSLPIVWVAGARAERSTASCPASAPATATPRSSRWPPFAAPTRAHRAAARR